MLFFDFAVWAEIPRNLFLLQVFM